MIELPGCKSGKVISWNPVCRTGAEPADVLATVKSVAAMVRIWPVAFHQPVTLGVGLEVIDRFLERNAGLHCQSLQTRRAKCGWY